VPTTKEVATECGISYRQIDYWIRQGYVPMEGETCPGSGYHRDLSDSEAEHVRAISELVKIGVRPDIAGVWAPELVNQNLVRIGSLTITKETPHV
jgi:hypothetical protein